MLFKFIGVGLLVVVAIVYYFFFAGMSSSGDTQYVYIDDDDTIDSVYTKLGEVSKSNAMTGFKNPRQGEQLCRQRTHRPLCRAFR